MTLVEINPIPKSIRLTLSLLVDMKGCFCITIPKLWTVLIVGFNGP